MNNEFRLTSTEYAKILGISVEALRSRRRREIETNYIQDKFGNYWWKNDRPTNAAVEQNDRPKKHGLFRDPGSKKIDTRKRNRGALARGEKPHYPNWKMEERNRILALGKIRDNLGDEVVDEITPELFELAKKKVAEKKLKAAEKELEKVEAGNQNAALPVGIDRTPIEYGQQLNQKHLGRIERNEDAESMRKWKAETDVQFREKRYTDAFGFEHKKKLVDFGYTSRPALSRPPPYHVGDWEEPGSVEFKQYDLDRIPDDREPSFSSKVEESIWRLKNKK
jgi:hypothetical protein